MTLSLEHVVPGKGCFPQVVPSHQFIPSSIAFNRNPSVQPLWMRSFCQEDNEAFRRGFQDTLYFCVFHNTLLIHELFVMLRDQESLANRFFQG